MIPELEGVTGSLLKLALDAAVLTQRVAADNIANAQSPNFALGRVSFEHQLAAVRATLAGGGRVDAGMLRGIAPLVERSAPSGAPNHVGQLDMEAALLGENSVRYQALLKAWSKHHSLLALAIGEGKH
ncbi:flagellar basal body rod protein FlgB [Massilia endophytica]|uniref:flagellar basal body rod protein FlgB n=1 Tax=Massilia endophytica TaxID=2899220 RepID=UPI001E3FA02A|nr:flagellar basal body protein [Massilia endophytica]UGQ47964.1 flagellar basal body protein [Massilia endophytica]